MAVPEQTPYKEYTANGSTTSFALEFQCKEKEHLIVKLNDVDANPSLWSLVGGSVVFNTAPDNGTKILIQRKTPNQRTTNYQTYNNSFNPTSLNEDLDAIWRRIQEEDVARYFLNQLISKNYLELLGNDQQVRGELLSQIIAQGISQRQIEDYTHNLMRSISSISAGKGWVSGLVEMTRGGTLDEFIESNIEKSLLDFIPIQHHQSIKNYEYTVDCLSYIQAAIDWATLNNRGLYVPAGGYLIGGSDPIYLSNILGSNRNLYIRGAGKGLTIWKEADGKTNRVGRFSKMLYFYYGVSGSQCNFGNIKISGITFDKNAASNINDSTIYHYEQAHIINFAGSGTGHINSVEVDGVEFIDKIGGGIVISSSRDMTIGEIKITKPTSRDHSKITGSGGDGTFGQRGCIETDAQADIISVESPNVIYMQSEPTYAMDRARDISILGGYIGTFEWTPKNDKETVKLDSVTVPDKYLARGGSATATNCTLNLSVDVHTGGTNRINGGRIILDYQTETNTITPITHGSVTGITDYSELHLSNLSIVINSNDPDIFPTGYAIAGNTAAMGARKRFLSNVTFDKRLEASIDAYANGDWSIKNCTLAGRNHHVRIGGYSTYGGKIDLAKNQYVGTGHKISVARSNTLWSASIDESGDVDNFFTSTGSTNADSCFTQLPRLHASSRPPTTVFAFAGQVVSNNAFLGNGVISWIKVATGTGSPHTFNVVSQNIFGTSAYTGETITANSRGVEQTITVTGAVLGDAVQVTLDKNLNGCVIEAYVSAANTVKARIFNPTAASVTLESANLKARLS